MANDDRVDFLDSATADRSMSIGGRLELFSVSLVIHILALTLPLALLQIYDRIIPNQSTGTVAFLVLGVGTAIFLEALLRYGRARMLAAIGARFDAQVPVVMVKRLLATDLAETDRRGAAALLDSFRSLGTVREFWSGNAAVSLYETPFVAVYVALIFYIGGIVAIVPAAIIVVAAIVAFGMRRLTAQAAARVEKQDRRRLDFLWTVIRGLSLVKAVGGERLLAGRYGALSAASMAENARIEALGAVLRESGAALGQISTVLVVSLGALMVIDGEMTTGALAACSILAGRSIGPALSGLGYLVRMGQVTEAESRVKDVLSLPPLATGSKADVPAHAVLSVAVEGGASFSVAPGEIVGIESFRPETASNLMAAIAGLRHEPSARTTLGDRDIPELDPALLRGRIAYVSESSVLFPGSILNNLTLFDPRLNAAARTVAEEIGLAEYFGRLRHGILTEVGGASGVRLDDGLIQRIGLVRAIVRQPSVLILDQADNSLDLDGERRLAALLERLRGSMAILVFSARPAVRGVCDRTERL